MDIVQVEYIRLELIEQSGELCPDFTGAEWAAQRSIIPNPGANLTSLGKYLLQGVSRFSGCCMEKTATSWPFLFQKLF